MVATQVRFGVELKEVARHPDLERYEDKVDLEEGGPYAEMRREHTNVILILKEYCEEALHSMEGEYSTVEDVLEDMKIWVENYE